MTERTEFFPPDEAKGCSPFGLATTIVSSAYRFFFDTDHRQEMYQWVQQHEPQINTNTSTATTEE